MKRNRRTPARFPVGLTGTPGTGKSSVARHLPSSWAPIEVGALALELGTGRRRGRSGVVVDLPATSRRWRRSGSEHHLLVGHLAHLLPVRTVVLLRCHPIELARRLARARRGTGYDRAENVASEAVDVILTECRALRRRVLEIDTTGRTPRQVARELVRAVRSRGRRPRSPPVDWLSDPAVTDYLERTRASSRSRRGRGRARALPAR